MKYKLSLAIFSWLLMAAQVSTHGKWRVYEWSSESTGTRTMSSKAGEYIETGNFLTLHRYFGLRCDQKEGSKTLLFIFDVGEPVAEPQSDVSVIVKIDDEKPIDIGGRMFTGSYEAGYVRYTSLMHSDLLNQMKAGDKLSVQVRSPTSRASYKVSLIGFTAANTPIIEMCDR